MPKVTLSEITTGHGTTTKLNANFDAIEQGFDNTLSRDGSSPNTMLAALDMNSNKVINLPDATSDSEPLTYRQYITGGASAVVNGFRKESQIATSGQTVFTANSVEWVPGIDNLIVFVNGEMYGNDLYTVDSGTQITFDSGLTLNDRVDFLVMSIASTQVNTTTDAGLVSYNPAGTYVTNAQDKLRESISVIDYGADPVGINDSTAAFQAALDNNKIVFVPEGVYLIDGTINMNKGNTLFGMNYSGIDGAYDIASIGDATRLIKDAGSSDGAIITMSDYASIRGLLFSHQKTNGGTDGIVEFPAGSYTRYCTIEACHFEGHRTGDVTGSTTCYGIKMTARTSVYVTYFNRISNVQVHNCDVCIHLGNQANANTFTNIQTKESHVHYELDGTGGEALENTFTGLGLFSISGSISPDPVGFKLTHANNNLFTSFATEMFGKAYEVNSSTCFGNVFLGVTNETVPSQPDGQTNLLYARPTNVSNISSMPLIQGTAGNRYDVGKAIHWNQIFEIAGTLPQQNNNSGTIIAGNASNKVLFRFPANFTKVGKTSFFGKLRIFANGSFGNGEGMVQVEFAYSKRDTTSSAGSFEVYRVDQTGDEITGLYFLTGVAAGSQMGVALTGGNYAATNFGFIRCQLEIFATAYDSFIDSFSDYSTLSTTTAADVTADDVTDAIDMLTVATTSV